MYIPKKLELALMNYASVDCMTILFEVKKERKTKERKSCAYFANKLYTIE